MFDNTRRALEDYDAGQADRDRRWEECRSDADADEARDADHLALNRVRRAFYRDTSDRNTKSQAMAACLDFMRRMTRRPA